MPPRPDGAPQCGRLGSRARAAGGDPPPSPARAGERHCPPARTVQVTGDSDCGPTSSDPPPSLARAWDRQCHPARAVPCNAGGPPPCDSESGPTPAGGHRLTPSANGRGSRRDLATLQSKGPLADLGGRRPTCKGHAPTYSLYTASGRQPRVYNASLVIIGLNADRIFARLTRLEPEIFSFLSDRR